MYVGTSAGGLTRVASCRLPTRWGEFLLTGFCAERAGVREEALLLTFGNFSADNMLVRIHSECMTGDSLFSVRCDCGAQLEAAFSRIAEEGAGAIAYLRQEGRGIGLLNKIRAYALQDSGLDTVQANLDLGFAADARHYGMAASVLQEAGIRSVRLMTNNPAKARELEVHGIRVMERISHAFGACVHNQAYLDTKRDSMGHLL